jgi:hypothetical protein
MIAQLALWLVCMVGGWLVVGAVLSLLSGYWRLRELKSQGTAEAEALARPWRVRFGLVSFSGWLVGFDANADGLGIHVLQLSPFFPPLRVPWHRLSVGTPFFWHCPVKLDGKVSLYVSSEVGRRIAFAQVRYGSKRPTSPSISSAIATVSRC